MVHGFDPNGVVLHALLSLRDDDRVRYACESMTSYGMPVGASVFESCYWIGRFMQAVSPRGFQLVPNSNVRSYVCRTPKAKDTHVRGALIERFGPVGVKKNPGPFYGVSGHVWSAVAVAVTYHDYDMLNKWEVKDG